MNRIPPWCAGIALREVSRARLPSAAIVEERSRFGRALSTLLVGIGLFASAVVVGCGSSQASFTAEGFVAAANEVGARVTLGQELFGSDPTYELKLERLPGDVAAPSASLIIAEDEAAAEQRFTDCDSAPALVCFRADNAVVVTEDPSQAAVARINGWIARLDE